MVSLVATFLFLYILFDSNLLLCQPYSGMAAFFTTCVGYYNILLALSVQYESMSNLLCRPLRRRRHHGRATFYASFYFSLTYFVYCFTFRYS